MAKRLFYVCAAILMIAISHHLGALSAYGQGVGRLAFASDPQGGNTAGVDEAGMLWGMSFGGSPRVGPIAPPKAGQIRWVSVQSLHAGEASATWFIAYEDGDCYQRQGTGAWIYGGNIFASPTPAPQSTWGQVKDRYRK